MSAADPLVHQEGPHAEESQQEQEPQAEEADSASAADHHVRREGPHAEESQQEQDSSLEPTKSIPCSSLFLWNQKGAFGSGALGRRRAAGCQANRVLAVATFVFEPWLQKGLTGLPPAVSMRRGGDSEQP